MSSRRSSVASDELVDENTSRRSEEVIDHVHIHSNDDGDENTRSSTPGFEIPLAESPNRIQTTTSLSLSRDEMNLAEFPLTVLSKRVDPNVKTLEFTDSIRGKNSELVERKWIITGADKFGLPTSSDDEVLLGLLKLTADDGLRNRKIYFTRYELLRVLRWTTEGRSYTRLQNALDRLSGVRIKATNAFYDNETKLHSTRNFGIVDAYEINDGRDTRPSFFTWSDVLFKSFQVGFIKKLDLDFYLNLRSAVSKRLYRYLDKHFWYKSRVQMNLFTLAHEKVGISRNYAYASSLKQQLEPAIEELIANEMLSKFEYIGKGSATEIVLYAARPSRRTLSAEQSSTRTTAVPATECAVNEVDMDGSVQSLLVIRGINEAQARRLVEAQNKQGMDRIRRIVGYYDSLVQMKSKLVSRNPQGFLYRAAENPFAFVLPEERSKNVSISEGNRPQAPLQFSAGATTPASEKQPARPVTDETDYLVARRQELIRMRDETPAAELTRISHAVEAALSRIKPLISETRFTEAVEHGVEQKLLKMGNFPDFETWKGAKR